MELRGQPQAKVKIVHWATKAWRGYSGLMKIKCFFSPLKTTHTHPIPFYPEDPSLITHGIFFFRVSLPYPSRGWDSLFQTWHCQFHTWRCICQLLQKAKQQDKTERHGWHRICASKQILRSFYFLPKEMWNNFAGPCSGKAIWRWSRGVQRVWIRKTQSHKT